VYILLCKYSAFLIYLAISHILSFKTKQVSIIEVLLLKVKFLGIFYRIIVIEVTFEVNRLTFIEVTFLVSGAHHWLN
jgi:hypothetical protein